MLYLVHTVIPTLTPPSIIHWSFSKATPTARGGGHACAGIIAFILSGRKAGNMGGGEKK